jgi:hypothetical protein
MGRSLLAISVIILNVTGSLAAEPPARAELKPVNCQIRILEGTPKGTLESGTLKVLAEPTLVTLETREAVFVVGGEVEIPGTDEKLPFGTTLKFTPGKIDQGSVFARISLEVVQLADVEDKSYAASSGSVVRAVGTFPCGKPIRIVARELGDGKQLWAEITLAAESQLAPAKKAPSGTFQEVPTARSRAKSSRQ